MTSTPRNPIDDAVEDTFPASDPPSHSVPTTSAPTQRHGPVVEGTRRVWRVVAEEDAGAPFKSRGDGKTGRWTSEGKSVVYAAGSPAAAILEFLAHLDSDSPAEVFLASAHFPQDLAMTASGLPSTWCDRPYCSEVQAIGDQWLAARTSYALQVPSALCKGEQNFLLNSEHVDAVHLQLGEVASLRLDDRLLPARSK